MATRTITPPGFKETNLMLTPPINHTEYFHLSIILLVLGFIMACWFLLYVVTYPKNERKVSREILLSCFSSIYLGLGSFFLMLTFGLNL